MPNRTTTASHSRPLANGAVESLMLVWKAAYMMPPTPAMAAETANSASLTRTGDTPDVAAPTSDDRTAAMLLPHDDRLRLLMSSITMHTSTSIDSAIVRLLARFSGPILGRGMVQPAVVLRNQFHWNST